MPETPSQSPLGNGTWALVGAAAVGIFNLIVFLVKRWWQKKEDRAEKNESILEEQQRIQIQENARRLEKLEKDQAELRIEILEELLKKLNQKAK